MLEVDPQAVEAIRSELRPMRGLWPGISVELVKMGFRALADLRGRDPVRLARDYQALCHHPDDPILTTIFKALVGFAETGEPSPWWVYVRAETRNTGITV
jgi:Pathogenicity locus